MPSSARIRGKPSRRTTAQRVKLRRRAMLECYTIPSFKIRETGPASIAIRVPVHVLVLSWIMKHVFRPAVLLVVCSFSVFGAIDGTVVNRTTGKPEAGVAVALV